MAIDSVTSLHPLYTNTVADWLRQVGQPVGVVNWTAGSSTRTMTADDARLERRRRRRAAVVSCGKRAVAFLFSHVGLAAMVVAYSILGGFLFRALEAPHEKRVKVQPADFRSLLR